MAHDSGPIGVNGHAAHDSALDVGNAERNRDLEEENSMLKEKVGEASQRFADYENEIRVLQAKLRQSERRNTEATASPSIEAPRLEKPGISRFGSFIGSRKPPTSLTPPVPLGPSAREQDLEATLIKEQTARIAAEQKVKEVNAEIEELSATLFQQANEMVASERKENALLKDQVTEMKKAAHGELRESGQEVERLRQKLRILEQREEERKRRLERLESAQKRVDRVRTMLSTR